MEKEIKCPKDNLERLLLLLDYIDFKSLDEEPAVEDAKTMAKVMNPTEEGEDIPKEYVNQAYRRFLRQKTEDRRGAEELAIYGKSREEIARNLGKHVRDCSYCPKKYSDFIMEGAVMHLKCSEDIVSESHNYPQEFVDLAKEEVSMGLDELVKQEDERFLGLLN
jgi:hypothetical protein